MSKRAKNILFGFNAPEFSDNIVQDLKNRGETVNSQVCLSKREIKEFLVGHPEFRHVVLLETLYKEDGTTEMYSAEELARMTDTHNINIIVVLAGKHRGTNFMKTLYAANITSALFQDEKQGASEEMIISLILKRRSRRNARTYYGIDRHPIKYSAVGGEHIDVLSELGNSEYGQSVLERFLILTKGMQAGELGDLIENLPLDIKNELSRYEEFYILLDAVKRKGGNVKFRKPKKVEFGLYVPEENILSEKTENTIERTSFDKEIDMDDIFTNEEENEDDGLKKMDTAPTFNNVSEDVSPSEDSDIFDLLFKFKYYYGINDGIGKENTLYTVAGDAVNLVNQKLSRKCVENKWIQAKSPRELLGWASAAFVGIKLSNQRNFKQFEDGVFRNRGVGSYHFPCECKYVIEGKEGLFPAYVAVIDSYLFYDERIHNESEYDEYVEKKLNAIRKYIRYRSNKGPCFIVCSCMDDSDLNELGSMMIRADFSQEELEHIYFTGAGAFDESRIVDCPYLRMKINESEDTIEYDFYAERPLFLI